MSPRKPVRVRKARGHSTCYLCRGAIVIGQVITSENRRPWVHRDCLIAARKAGEPSSGRTAP